MDRNLCRKSLLSLFLLLFGLIASASAQQKPDYNKLKPALNGNIPREVPKYPSREQVIAYLFLPLEGKPPYQCMVYMADGGTLRPGSGDTIRPDSYILRSGRAMLYPIF